MSIARSNATDVLTLRAELESDPDLAFLEVRKFILNAPQDLRIGRLGRQKIIRQHSYIGCFASFIVYQSASLYTGCRGTTETKRSDRTTGSPRDSMHRAGQTQIEVNEHVQGRYRSEGADRLGPRQGDFTGSPVIYSMDVQFVSFPIHCEVFLASLWCASYLTRPH